MNDPANVPPVSFEESLAFFRAFVSRYGGNEPIKADESEIEYARACARRMMVALGALEDIAMRRKRAREDRGER